MKKLAQLWITLCLALPGLIAHGDTTLVANINGYSLDADRELIQFTAIQFSDDRVDRLFSDGDSLPENVDTRIDGNGLTLIPGLIDAHGHVLNYGLSLFRVDLIGTRSEQSAVQRVVDFAAENTELDWIQGRGWNQVLWTSNSFPSAASLDTALSINFKVQSNTLVNLSNVM